MQNPKKIALKNEKNDEFISYDWTYNLTKARDYYFLYIEHHIKVGGGGGIKFNMNILVLILVVVLFCLIFNTYFYFSGFLQILNKNE